MKPTPDAPLEAALYVVATPIGNLADITTRACTVLAGADVIAAEDTRSARRLLQSLGLGSRPLVSAHAHNERERGADIVRRIAQGQSCALVSDAGTPAISDPGARIVAAVHEAGLAVVPVPGCSALAALLSVAGIDADRYGEAAAGFWFEGFLPARERERDQRLAWLLGLGRAFVLYEAPHRIGATLAALDRACAEPRELIIGRELTKRFEQIVRLRTDTGGAWLISAPEHGRGEFCVVVAPPPARVPTPDAAIDWQATAPCVASLDALLAALSEALPPRAAARIAASLTGLPSRRLYDRIAGRGDRAPPADDAG